MNAAIVLALLASFKPGADAPLPNKQTPIPKVSLPKKPGSVTFEVSEDRGTHFVSVSSAVRKLPSGALATEVEIQGTAGRVTTRKQGASAPTVHDRPTAIILEIRLAADANATFAARMEAQLDRCATLAMQAPKKTFVATLLLSPEGFEDALADVKAAATVPPLRLTIDAAAIEELTCRAS
jgi:hypothetical protein